MYGWLSNFSSWKIPNGMNFPTKRAENTFLGLLKFNGNRCLDTQKSRHNFEARDTRSKHGHDFWYPCV